MAGLKEDSKRKPPIREQGWRLWLRRFHNLDEKLEALEEDLRN